MRVGVIGVGLLGGQHADVIARHDRAELAAVADPRKAVGQKVAGETGAACYETYAAMLKAEALDAVIVATPDPAHRAPVVAAARAGVPIIITEKPMATTTTDARRMRDAVAKAGADLYILFPNRFNPLDRVVRYAFANKLIGAPVHGDVRLDDSITVPRALWGRRSRAWAGGSSTAHFLLSHVVDLLRWYFQPADVAEVYAVTQRRVLGHTPDLYDAYLTFDSGLTVRVKAEWIRHIEALVEFELTFSAAKGGIVYRKHPAYRSQRGLRLDVEGETPSGLARHLKRLARQAVRGRVVSDPAGRSPLALEFHGEDNPLNWDAALNHYLTTLVEGRREVALDGFGPLPGLRDALRQVDIVAAIVQSANRRRTVSVRYSD